MNKPALRPLAAALLVALPLAIPATAEAQSWMARVRAINISPDVSSSIPGLDVKDQWAPELDFSYFFSKNLAAELILSTARHEVTLDGNSIGKVSILPPTITLQYHFTDLGLGALKPYVGAGLNYTRFSNVSLPSGLSIDKNSFGGALQIGTDFAIDKNWSVNLDVKKVWIRTDLSAAGATLGKIKVDPVLVGVGVGYKF